MLSSALSCSSKGPLSTAYLKKEPKEQSTTYSVEVGVQLHVLLQPVRARPVLARDVARGLLRPAHERHHRRLVRCQSGAAGELRPVRRLRRILFMAWGAKEVSQRGAKGGSHRVSHRGE